MQALCVEVLTSLQRQSTAFYGMFSVDFYQGTMKICLICGLGISRHHVQLALPDHRKGPGLIFIARTHSVQGS